MSYHSRNQLTYGRPIRRNDISASTTSALTSNPIGGGIYLVKITNNTGAKAYILPVQLGGTVTTATGVPVQDSSEYHIAVRPGEYLAAILASGSGAVEITEMSV